jgi:hypothetical protein
MATIIFLVGLGVAFGVAVWVSRTPGTGPSRSHRYLGSSTGTGSDGANYSDGSGWSGGGDSSSCGSGGGGDGGGGGS